MRWRECTATAYQEPPSARLGHTAVLVDARSSWGEELLVVYGGLNGDKQPLGDLAVLQTASEAWFHPTTANAGPPPRAFHCAAAVGGRLYVFGGHVYVKETKGMQKYNDLWCLNTDNWEWSQVKVHPDSPQPSPRDFLDMVSLPGGQLLIFGGLEASEKRSDETWVFDCSSCMWAELDLPIPRPKPRFAHKLTKLDQRVLLCGGCAENATSMLNDLWLLKGVLVPEDAEPCWVPLELPGVPPSPRKAHALAAAGSHVVLFGGHSSELGWFRSKTDTYHSDVAVLERHGTVQWQQPVLQGGAPAGREFHSLTAISPTRLLMFGGGNGKTIFSDAWWLCLDEEGSPLQPSAQTLAPLGLEHHLEGHKAHVDPTRAESTMSEVSGADQCLLGTAHLATTRDRNLRVGAPRSGSSDYLADNWWSGSGADADFEALLYKIGAPLRQARVSEDVSGERSFWALARKTNSSANVLLEESAAREHFMLARAPDLLVGEAAALLWDYKRLCSSPKHPPDSLSQLQQQLLQPGPRRFSHLQARDIRVGDIPEILAAYKALATGS